MLVINLLGEPGVGKSLTASGLFYLLGVNQYRAEIVSEVAKGYAWETPKDKDGNALLHPIFGQQIFLLGEQNRFLERLNGKRDIAIMECPLIMMAIYEPENYFKNFKSLVLEQFNHYNNVNILLERNHNFDKDGRVHNEDESKEVRKKLIDFLENNQISYKKMTTNPNIHQEIYEYITSNFINKK